MESKGIKNKEAKAVNYVHKSIIHTETIGKEKKYESVNFKYEYTFSPYTFYPISDKPTSIDSSRPFTSRVLLEKQSRREYKVNKEPIANAFMKDRISKSIAKHSQTPKEKYDMPLTSNQEIGWYSKPLLENSKFNRPLTSTAITKYVESYHATERINPFKIPISSFKMK